MMNAVKQAKQLLRTVIIGVALLGAGAAQAMPIPVDFQFSFINDSPDGNGGTVTVVVRGVAQSATSATSVEVIANTEGFGPGGVHSQ